MEASNTPIFLTLTLMEAYEKARINYGQLNSRVQTLEDMNKVEGNSLIEEQQELEKANYWPRARVRVREGSLWAYS